MTQESLKEKGKYKFEDVNDGINYISPSEIITEQKLNVETKPIIPKQQSYTYKADLNGEEIYSQDGINWINSKGEKIEN
jgi:hypothetical protein